jgi:hypothetical protein
MQSIVYLREGVVKAGAGLCREVQSRGAMCDVFL